MRKLNKKASGTDVIFVFLLIIAMTFFSLIFLHIVRNFTDGINASSANDEAKDMLTNFQNDLRGRIDNSLILYVIILFVGTWVSSYFLDNHPMYFVLFMIISFLSFFILLPFANVIYNFYGDTALAQEIEYLPKIFFIIEHFAAFISFYIVTTSIVLYAKSKFGNRT